MCQNGVVVAGRSYSTSRGRSEMRSLIGSVAWTVTLLSSAMARADNWTSAAPLSEAREGLGAVGLPNGRVVAFGGHRGSTFFTLAEIYDPATDALFPVAPMPTPRACQASGLCGRPRFRRGRLAWRGELSF